ncbi:MAG: type II secretion system minor pseudopilin GspK [Nitrospirota bacterium]|nr:type II secretion system minor pseudopilin GspK [Nitrospirota bacterium]
MKRPVIGDEKGFVLIVALLVTAVLVIVITEVVQTVQMSVFSVGVKKDSQRAAILAEGGVELASRAIAELNKGKNFLYLSKQDAVRSLPVGDGVLTISIEDEQGKLNPNLIIMANGEVNPEAQAAYERLVKACGYKKALSDALIDWIDKDELPRGDGAEGYDYYRGLNPPYDSKNAPLSSADELRLVKGYDDPGAFASVGGNVTPYTDGRLNINDASSEAIMSLSPDITQELAQRAVDYRTATPFENTADIRKVAGFETIGFAVQGRITVNSALFRIRTRATVGDAVREAESVVDITGKTKVLYWRQR